MDQRNLVLAIVMSLAILFGFQFLFPPPKPPVPQQTTEGGLNGEAQTSTPGGSVPSLGNLPGSTIPTGESREQAIEASPRITIQNRRLSGSISLRGAKVDDLVLTEFKETLDPDSPMITLLSPEGSANPYFSRFGWAAAGSDIALPDSNTLWEADSGTLAPNSPVTLRWNNGQGLTFEQAFTLDDEYLFTVTQRVLNNGGAEVKLAPFGLIARTGTPDILGFYILHEGPIGWLNEALEEYDYDGDLKDEYQGQDVVIGQETTGGWIGITDKYWLTALVPDQKDKVKTRFVYTQPNGKDHYQSDFLYEASTVPSGSSTEMTSRLFAGAKQVPVLQAYQEDLGIVNFDLAVDFGWFGFLTKPLFQALHWLHAQVGNFGIAILLLTIGVKLVFFPLANKSYKSMAKMRKLQPKMMELRERFGEDKQRLNQEMMGLYKKEGANPLSGCLPIMVQIPVFFALYKVMFVTIEMRQAPFFGWIKDLSAPDPTSIINGFGLLPWDVPDLGLFNLVNIGVWPLLMGISMFLQQKLNPQPPDPMQAKIFMLMPIMFTFLLATFPAGLVVYWTWNNMLSMAQQAFIMKRQGVPLGNPKPPTKPTT